MQEGSINCALGHARELLSIYRRTKQIGLESLDAHSQIMRVVSDEEALRRTREIGRANNEISTK